MAELVLKDAKDSGKFRFLSNRLEKRLAVEEVPVYLWAPNQTIRPIAPMMNGNR